MKFENIMHEITSKNTAYSTFFFFPSLNAETPHLKKGTAGSMNKVPTNANIHMALKNNEICSHLWELPKAINKKKNRSYCIIQNLLSKT